MCIQRYYVVNFTHRYTADVQVLCKSLTVYRQLHTIHSIHTDFEIHLRFFTDMEIEKSEKVSGTEIKFLLEASIACVSTLRHFSEKLYLLIQLRASIACVRTLCFL